MEEERQKREHIWTGIRTAKEAKKGGGDRRIGLVMAKGGAGELSGAFDGWTWGWVMDDVSEGEVFSLLERSPGAWVRLACHHWVACYPSLDWELRPHSVQRQEITAHSQYSCSNVREQSARKH